jgi:hypothetical protein
VRNSSLVKWFCADNVAGLKYTAEAAALTLARFLPTGREPGVWVGRGASCSRGSAGVIQVWRLRE